MSPIPNYLRTITNRYKGSITEKVASHYLKKNGFYCEKFDLFEAKLGSVKYKQKKTNELRQAFLEMKEEQFRRDKEYFQRQLEKFSHKSPPKDWKEKWLRQRVWWVKERTWEEIRKGQIKSALNQIKIVEQEYKKNIEFERTWGTHFRPIINYCKFCMVELNYQPDFIAKKGDKVFIVEVKSRTKRGVAPLGKHQKRGLVKAYNYGLTPMLLVVPIDISIKTDEPEKETIDAS